MTFGTSLCTQAFPLSSADWLQYPQKMEGKALFHFMMWMTSVYTMPGDGGGGEGVLNLDNLKCMQTSICHETWKLSPKMFDLNKHPHTLLQYSHTSVGLVTDHIRNKFRLTGFPLYFHIHGNNKVCTTRSAWLHYSHGNISLGYQEDQSSRKCPTKCLMCLP